MHLLQKSQDAMDYHAEITAVASTFAVLIVSTPELSVFTWQGVEKQRKYH